MGNRYDEVYDFKLASISDVDRIMDFIKREWASDHILANNKELFLWQYGRREYGDYDSINVVLLTDKRDSLLGVIGFVAYDEKNNSITPALTKVLPHGLLPMTGLEFMVRQAQIVGEKNNIASGINPTTVVPLIKKYFNCYTGIMQQYYMINPTIKNYKVAVPGKDVIKKKYIQSGYSFKEFRAFEDIATTFDLAVEQDRMIFKSPEYIRKRFFEHPIYKYRKWFILDGHDEIRGIIFGREIECNEVKVLRLVDYRGSLDELRLIGEPLHRILEKEGYEYIDLMVSNLTDYHMEEAGFSLLDPDGDIVIPNYFEPFVQKNIKSYYQYRDDEIVIFKADGDQDRPNRIIDH